MSCAGFIDLGVSNGAGGGGLAPVASFTEDNDAPNIGDVIQFTDTSANSPTTWQWYANGALISNLQNPSYYCSTQGYVTFELLASNGYGSDSHSKQIYVGNGM